MKFAIFLIASALPLHADLLATFHTTRGDVTAVLQYDKTPQAVANFITMAQGTRPRVDSVTGNLTTAPLYAGEKFFRVINDATFKIIQTGSGSGTNSGDPGFTFRDEFDPTLTHVPYVLSMANSGFNSNGSQIFLTGNAPAAHLNSVHTVFGLIPDPASRAVIDAIHSAGSDATTIQSVSFSRTDAAALAFDEFAQNLPMLTPAKGKLEIVKNVSSKWIPSEAVPVWDTFHASRSLTLASGSWTNLMGKGVGNAGAPVTLDIAAAEKAFYKVSVMKHPGALSPPSFANRTLRIVARATTYTYVFDSTGFYGNATSNDGTNQLSYAFRIYDYALKPFSFALIVQNSSESPYSHLLFQIGCDSATSTLINARQTTQGFKEDRWYDLGSGAGSITR